MTAESSRVSAVLRAADPIRTCELDDAWNSPAATVALETILPDREHAPNVPRQMPARRGRHIRSLGLAAAALAALVETLYRGLADNSLGKVIDTLLRNELVIVDELGFAPLDDTGAQLLFRFVAAAYERRSIGIASHWPFESWGRFLPEHTTAVSMLDRLLHHCHTVVTDGDSYRMKQARQRTGGRETTK